MKYQNTTTGFVFDTPCEIKAEGWVKLDPQPDKVKEDKPVKSKRVKKSDD